MAWSGIDHDRLSGPISREKTIQKVQVPTGKPKEELAKKKNPVLMHIERVVPDIH